MSTAISPKVEMREFADGEELAGALANAVARRLNATIDARGSALLVLSGGTTPKRFLARLKQQPIDWVRLVVTLTDERCVPADHPRSNSRLLREQLLDGPAAQARYVPLHSDADDLAARTAELAQLPPPAVTVLGLGTDGHIASLFPDGDAIDAALAPDAPPLLYMNSPSVPERRVTYSLAALARSAALFLHIEGEAKLEALERSLAAGDDPHQPLPALSRTAAAPIQVVWAP